MMPLEQAGGASFLSWAFESVALRYPGLPVSLWPICLLS